MAVLEILERHGITPPSRDHAAQRARGLVAHRIRARIGSLAWGAGISTVVIAVHEIAEAL